jgi:hypothetical protein
MLAVAAALLALAGTRATAEQVPPIRTDETIGTIRLHVVDITPQFLDFYEAAKALPPGQRFAEWKKRYGFAAVPPTPQGDAIARKLLDSAWPKYEAALPVIRRGYKGMEPKPAETVAKVAQLLGATKPMELQLTAYVGAFEGNAFTAIKADGTPVVSIPVEMPANERARVMPHEFTHAMHASLAGLSPGYERSLGRVIFEEGLAMHVAKAVGPAARDKAYVEYTPGWYARAMAKRRQILRGLLPNLRSKDAKTVFKYTMGSGSQGLEREAYLAGWLVIGRLLEQSRTYPELARIPENELPDLVARTIRDLLADKGKARRPA